MNKTLHYTTCCIAALLCAFIYGTSQAQNLVINGDFETFSPCPTSFSMLSRATGWVQTTDGTSDYFNRCASTTVGVPGNVMGYQQPRSGDGYGGLYGCITLGGPQSLYQEFMSTKLATPLIKDNRYCIKFFMSPTAGPNTSTPAIFPTSIAAFISDTLPTKIPRLAADPPRFIMNDTNRRLTDTAIWHEVSGTYKARGGEEWLTIGVFFNGTRPPLAHPTPGAVTSFINYFYIDDVSVTPQAPSPAPVTLYYCNEPIELTARATAGPYKWNTGDTGRTITASRPGVYYCTIRQDCFDAQDTIIILPAPISDTVIETRIQDCKTIRRDLTLTPPITGMRYNWSNGDTTRTIQVAAAGSYTCEVMQNCRIYRVKFEVAGFLLPPPELQDTTVCQHSESPVIQTGYSDLVWFTSTGAGPFTEQPAIPTDRTGPVLLYASRRLGSCISSKQPVTITVDGAPRPLPPQEIVRCNDRPSELRIGARVGVGREYEWSTGDTGFQIPMPALDGQYIRTVTGRCFTALDTFNVRSGACNDCVVFPNAFTPNGDGLNDEFRGMIRCQHTEYFLRIYNRWGQMIFVTSRPETGWNGSYSGIPAPTETYMYQCTLRNVITGEQQRVQGDVLLIR